MTQAAASVAHPGVLALIESVAKHARQAGVFGLVRAETQPPRLVAEALASGEPAEYRLDVQDGRLWVSLVTPARYLSQSIEQDLVHQGDKIDDLLADELIDQEASVKRLAVEHFRSADKLFTFRAALPIDLPHAGARESIDLATRVLLAFEACFGPLGDMSAGAEDE